MKQKTKTLIWIFSIEGFTVIMMFISGFIFGHFIITDSKNAIGIYFSNAGQDYVERTVKEDYHPTDWVCVDISRQDYADAMQTCQHEVAHYMFKHEVPKEDYTREDSEAFARKCEELLIK